MTHEEDERDQFINAVGSIAAELNTLVFGPLDVAVSTEPRLRNHLSPAFPFPRKLRVGITATHMCVEFVGPEEPHEAQLDIEGVYLPNGTVFEFLEIDLKTVRVGPVIPHDDHVQNMTFFLGDAMRLLTDYLYDVVHNPSDLMLNGYLDFTQAKQPIFISNTSFLWPETDGSIRVRHIDFLELMPIVDEQGYAYRTVESMVRDFVPFLLQHRVPQYDIALHRLLNEFIELVHSHGVTEPSLTTFLAEHPEILQLAFGSHDLNPQTRLEWQGADPRPSLQPDFLPVRMDGFADILEFKLPWLGGAPMVGSEPRSKPSAEIDRALAQIDEYADWCSQDVNRRWLETTKGIKVHSPTTHLVIGHSKEFAPGLRQMLRDRRNALIYTYDEFIAAARMNLYRTR